MKIGVLTSSRADYGIYQPLLKAISLDDFFDLYLLTFGSHLAEKSGNTIQQIEDDGYKIAVKLDTLPMGDTALDISQAIGKTITAFSDVWAAQNFDLVFALGDRYEMFGAVSAALPFNIKIAHIHGGETTLGSIDNAFRYSITSMANLHFTAAEFYKQRVIENRGSGENVYNVGALSIDNIRKMHLLSINEFKEKFDIVLSIPSILITFHPETINFEKNKEYVSELIAALRELNQYQLIITMPNNDTMGLCIRDELNNFIEHTSNVIGLENLGSLGYLSCMKHCKMILGNSSSGFIEAAGLNKPVVNLGDRQKGRILTPNIFNSTIQKEMILESIKEAENFKPTNLTNIYGDGNAAERIIHILKSQFVND